MNSYKVDNAKAEWNEYIKKIDNFNDSISKNIFSTKDFHYAGWETAKHGLLILDCHGTIIDANPYFCTKLEFNRNEILGKNIDRFNVRGDSLVDNDPININTLILNNNQSAYTSSRLSSKNQKLFKCRWIANRIPSDLDSKFSYSIIHVYFICSINFDTIQTHVDKIEKKESNIYYKILDSVWGRTILLIIVILTALNGSLPELIKHLINYF